MRMLSRPSALVVVAVAVLVAAGLMSGCSGNNPLGLTTASTAPPPVVDDSTTRVAQVAWTSARAEKCGFVLDHERLRTSYLTYEGTRGTDPAALGKVEQAYGISRRILAAKIADKPDYCSPATVEAIRKDIARYLAGDFSARAVTRPIEE